MRTDSISSLPAAGRSHASSLLPKGVAKAHPWGLAQASRLPFASAHLQAGHLRYPIRRAVEDGAPV